MNVTRRSLAVCLPVVGLLSGCDTFAPPPKRRPDPQPMLPATSTVATTNIPPPTAGTVPTSTSSTTSPATTATCSGARLDQDGDGYTIPQCPPGVSAPNPTPESDDCDDHDPTRHQSQQLFLDVDGDGLGNPSSTQWVCEGVEVPMFVDSPGDCDDFTASAQTWVVFDQDGDQYGDGESVCGLESANWSLSGGDCVDTDSAINPSALDLAWDGIDSNCDTYDVPVTAVDEPEEVIEWTGGALCEGSVLAVVGLDRGTRPPGGVYLQIANVGTELVAEATFILNKKNPATDQPTTSTPLPPLGPGEGRRTQLIPYGLYDVHFTYPLFPPTPLFDADSGANMEGGVDAGGVGSHTDATTDAATLIERCSFARQVFSFSSQLIEPL